MNIAEAFGWAGVGIVVLALSALVLVGLGRLSGVTHGGKRDPRGWWLLERYRRQIALAIPAGIALAAAGFFVANNF